MKNWIINLSLLLLFVSFSGHAQKKRGINKYKEDLSIVRAGLDVTIDIPQEKKQALPSTIIIDADTINEEKPRGANTVNKQVDTVLSSIAKLRKATRYLSGYTIQVYAGQSRQEAIETRSQIVTAINKKKEQELEAINEKKEQDISIINDQEENEWATINNPKKKESEVILYYNQPNFLVTMGEYFSQLEAQKDLFQIKSYFPKAILVPKNIPVTKREN